jgi:hypothetical protein
MLGTHEPVPAGTIAYVESEGAGSTTHRIGRDGVLSSDSLPLKGVVRLTLLAGKAHGEWKNTRCTLDVSRAQWADGGTLYVPPAASGQFRIVDEAGSPLCGLDVRASLAASNHVSAGGVTDSQGLVVPFADSAHPVGRWRLRTLQGEVLWTGDVGPVAADPIEITLVGRRVLRIRLVDWNSEPIATPSVSIGVVERDSERDSIHDPGPVQLASFEHSAIHGFLLATTDRRPLSLRLSVLHLEVTDTDLNPSANELDVWLPSTCGVLRVRASRELGDTLIQFTTGTDVGVVAYNAQVVGPDRDTVLAGLVPGDYRIHVLRSDEPIAGEYLVSVLAGVETTVEAAPGGMTGEHVMQTGG